MGFPYTFPFKFEFGIYGLRLNIYTKPYYDLATHTQPYYEMIVSTRPYYDLKAYVR